MKNFDEQVRSYEQTLTDFIAEHELPGEWFEVPDHLAVKYYDAVDFEKGLGFWKPKSKQLSYIEMDGRRLATSQLLRPISVGVFGEVRWLEIMEPRPAKVGKDVVGLEHMEFYYPDFVSVREILEERGISYEMQQNPSHAWVNIVLNDSGQELKLNNGTLADIVTHELESGEARIYE